MMRFYDVQRGSVIVNGVDVREHSLLNFAVNSEVLQDPFLFQRHYRREHPSGLQLDHR